MVKVPKTLSVDPDVWNEHKSLYPGVYPSNIFEETLRMRINAAKDDASGISLEILEREAKKVTDKANKYAHRSRELRTQIELKKELMQKAEDKELVEKKLAFENQRKCSSCKTVVSQESELRELFGESFCRDCFMAGAAQELQRKKKRGGVNEN